MSKPMTDGQFLDYYRLNECLCGAEKESFCALCSGCAEHIRTAQPQLYHDIQNATGDPLLQAMGELRELIRGAQ